MAFIQPSFRSLSPRFATLNLCSLSSSRIHPAIRHPARFLHTPASKSLTTMVAKEGSPAPDFSALDADGNTISISALKGSNVVLYFSNGAGPGCTAQSCAFRDAAEDFANLDAKIISVSAQSQTSNATFRTTNSLPFPVVADADSSLQKLYGVPSTLGLIPGRVTYVIDKEGIVRKIYNSQFSTAQHIKVASETLASLPK